MMAKDKGRVEPVIDPALLLASSSGPPADATNTKKKSKKRRHTEDGNAPEVLAERKRKKKHHAEESVAQDVSDEASKKHKKKEKDKVQAAGDTVAPPSDAQANEEATVALVSALMAANAAQDGHAPQDAYGAPQPMPVDTTAFLNDMAIASNDEVLQALQHLDLSKIDNLLKSLSETPLSELGGAMPFPPEMLMGMPMPMPVPSAMPMPPPGSMPQMQGMHMLPAGVSVPAEPTAMQSRPRKGRFVAPPPPGTTDTSNEPTDHAWLLANKWMNSSKLAELAKTDGLIYKKGKFSAVEESALKDAIQRFREVNDMSEAQLYDMVFAKVKGVSHQRFWSEITAALPQRPLNAVYHYVKRAYHPMSKQGKWTEEEDARLKQAVADLGPRWEQVGPRVGRMPADCRDRYRNHLKLPDRNVGPWTQAEEDELVRVVKRLTVDKGRDFEQDVFWSRVSAEMGGKRSRQQCRIKWTDSLSKTLKNADKDKRWSQEDAFILVHKVDALNVRDDTEIDWKILLDPGWNVWSPHTLQRRWTTLKRSIKGWEDMSHAEIMDILRIKKGMPPLPPSSRRRAKKRPSTGDAKEGTSASRVVSREFIEDSGSEASGSESN